MRRMGRRRDQATETPLSRRRCDFALRRGAGRAHFPDHSAKSAELRLVAGGSVGGLIAMDMDAHLLKADGVPEFAARPEAASLPLTALAELHANAAMFGGIEATSFKINWKALDRTGRRVLAAWD